jgi:hypothetical protein
MGKVKKEKNIEFNPADYDYMDSMPLEGWIWEFMRRSDEHKKYWSAYKEMKDKYNKNEISSEELSEFRENHWFIKTDQSAWIYKYYFSEKDPSEKWDNKKDSHKDSMYRCLDGISKSYPIDVINLKWFLYPDGTLIAHGDDKTQMYPLVSRDPMEKLSLNMGNENILMALIDISAPMSIEKIFELIKPHLKEWRKLLKVHVTDAKTPKKNPNKLLKKARIWKSYLIIYDLMKECLSNLTDETPSKKEKSLCHEMIRNILFEHDDSYNTETVIRRHYNNAEIRINGGYRKFL